MEAEEFNCEQDGSGGDGGGGDNEEPVNFIVEFPVPCLICGTDLEIDGIVKKEISNFEGNSGGGGDSDSEMLFNWFLKWFRVDIGGKGKKRVGVGNMDRGGGEDGGDVLRFCGVCKNELRGLLVVQRQLEELEEKIRNGLEMVRRNMERCEEVFKISGVYERDQRYKRVRSRIVKGNSGPRSISSNTRPSAKSSSRKSTRKRTLVSRFSSTSNNEAEDDHLHALSYSSSEQVSTLDRLLVSHGEIPDVNVDLEDIKPDITCDFDDYHHKSPPPTATPPPPQNSTKNSRKLKPIKKKTPRKNLSKPKSNKKTENKSQVPIPPSKKSKTVIKANQLNTSVSSPPSSSTYLNDDTDNYFLDDNSNEESESEDDNNKQLNSRPQRKRRKINVEVDEDFILEDDNEDSLSEDDDLDKDWSLRSEGRNYQRYTYDLDPTTNTITVGSVPFTISGDQSKVTCNLCCDAAPPVKNDKDNIRRHMTKYHTDRFTCPHCPYRGDNNVSLQLHIEVVHEGKMVKQKVKQKEKFPCKICGKPIRHQRNHEWSHMNEEEREEVTREEPQRLPDWLKRRIQCEDCGKDFSGGWQLRKHREREHEGVEKEKELCAECGGCFKDLEKHRKSQHGGVDGGKMEKRWECAEVGCEKKFGRLKGLTRHKNAVHRKLRPWRCEECGREFGGEGSLREHVNGHRGVRPWKCEGEGCGAAFNRKAHLQRHWRIYHEEGSRPKRKAFLRGPTVLGADFKKKELQREGTYYPPSALRGWAKGRVPGHLMDKEGNK